MSLFSQQILRCCICGAEYEASVASGTRWSNGVCSMRCHYEKDWRGVLSTLGKPYKPDTREYDTQGYPKPDTYREAAR